MRTKCGNWWWKISSNHTNQGIPQGSVLGLVLLTLYMSVLGNLCWAHSLTFHGYADDSQNYLFFHSSVKGSREQCIEVVNNCLQNIRIWMQTNFLKLNDERTEFITFRTKQQWAKYHQLQSQLVTTPLIVSTKCVILDITWIVNWE